MHLLQYPAPAVRKSYLIMIDWFYQSKPFFLRRELITNVPENIALLGLFPPPSLTDQLFGRLMEPPE